MFNRLKAQELNSLWRDAPTFLTWITNQGVTPGPGGVIMMAAMGVATTRAAAIGDPEGVVVDTMVVEEAAAEEAPMAATEEDGAVVAEEEVPMEVMITATEVEVAGMTVVTSKREIGSNSHQEDSVGAYKASQPVCQAASHTATTRHLPARKRDQQLRHSPTLSLLATLLLTPPTTCFPKSSKTHT